MDISRFESLLDRYLTGEASRAELADFGEYLRSDPRLRRVLVERSLLEVHLHKRIAHPALLTVGAAASARLASPVRWFVRTLVALAALVVVGVGIVAWMGQYGDGDRGAAILSGQVKIGGMAAAVSHIHDGEKFEVASDGLDVQLPDGSRVQFDPSSLGLIVGRTQQARQTVELFQGGGNFQVNSGDGQFQVVTPAGTVTALGTEFRVSLQDGKKGKGQPALAVRVIEGFVRVDARGKSRVLAVGDNQVFKDDGDQNNTDDGQKNQSDDGQKNDGDQKNKN